MELKLRKLMLKDKQGMYEWMKDPSINRYYRFDPDRVTLEGITQFIEESLTEETNVHLAIVDEQDEYLGTVSLKNVDKKDYHAEYAISMRSQAVGKGFGKQVTALILEIAFNQYHLHKVYLNVFSNNVRAIKSYQKSGFQFEGTFKEHVNINGKFHDLDWYSILREDWKQDG